MEQINDNTGMIRNLFQLVGKEPMSVTKDLFDKWGPPDILSHPKDLEGRLIGFFSKKEKLGIGVIIEVKDSSTMYDSVTCLVLLGNEFLDLRIKCMARDGSLWITNSEKLPYCQFLREEI